MNNLAPGDLPMMMQEKTEFVLDGRRGRVAQNRVSECMVIWDKWTDENTGEVHGGKCDLLCCLFLGQMLESNRLHITARPEYRPDGKETIYLTATKQRSKEQHNRAAWRLSHIEAADELIAEGLMRSTRAEYERCIDAIKGRANTKQTQRAKGLTGRKKAGFKYECMAPSESGASVFRWSNKYKKIGVDGLFDRQDKSGNTSSRYSVSDLNFAQDIIKTRLNEERADIQSIVTSVRAAFHVENDKRKRHPELGQQLKMMGYHKVWDLIAQIAQIAPVDHEIRTKGMDVAYKDLHCLGLGLQISRPMERCELDVYEVDVMVLLNSIGILGHLTEAERLSMGLDGTAQRVRLSAIIDVYTGCILAFQIATSDTTDLALRTVEMAYLNKQSLADAVGALSPWYMRGHIGELGVDRGNSYLGEDFFLRLAAAGITNLGVPAGKPFLKPWIESWFRGVGKGFMQRFTGRTFGNIIDKGENDAQARATLNLDEFLFWLTRWIVDSYHNTPRKMSGKRAPRLEWDAAVKETPPYALVDDNQLRIAFGISVQRKLTRQGIRVGNLFYWSEDLISHFLRGANKKDRKLTVHWWAPKIGGITVELPDGRSVQAECTDPKWHGKCHDDVVRHFQEAAHLDALAIDSHYYAIAEMDAFSHQKAEIAKLIPHSPNEATLNYFEEKFGRFVNIPSRRLKGMTYIFGDEIIFDPTTPTPKPELKLKEPTIQAQTESETSTTHGTGEDIME